MEMNIYYARKIKGRRCTSLPVVLEALAAEGRGDLTPSHLESGAPVLLLSDGSAADLSISVTDTKNYILVGLAPFSFGIDAEEKGRKVRPSSVRALSRQEQTLLSGLSEGSSEWTGEFLRIWTGKESYTKLCGAGLRMGMSTFTVAGEDGSYLDRICKKGYPEGFWRFCTGPSGLFFSICSEQPIDGAEFVLTEPDFPPEESVSEAAAKLLDVRAYSKKEMEKKLQDKGYSKEEAQETCRMLSERGYLSDEEYARSAALRQIAKGSGKKKILQELEKKGIEKETALQTLELLQQETPDERERAMEAALRIWDPRQHPDEEGQPGRPDERTRAKIARKLYSMGFESGIIWEILGKMDRSFD